MKVRLIFVTIPKTTRMSLVYYELKKSIVTAQRKEILYQVLKF